MSLRSLVLLAGAALLGLQVLAAPASAGQRVALVIGNASYAHAPSLANPLNDATDIGAALDRLGFAVTRIDNADQVELRRGLQQFSLAASASKMAVVFYAGHGIEVDKRNFLIPIDARLRSDADVEFETVPLDLLSRAVERAKGLRLIILDACRDNPFAVAMQRSGATRSIGRGLASVEPSGETLVAYAAKEGTVASDGEGRKPNVQIAVTPDEPERVVSPEPAPPAPDVEEASLGLERAERRQIQMGLAALGFDPGPADGLFGQRTRASIGGWQSSQGGNETGYLDAEAAKLLLAAGEEAARKRAAEEERKRAAMRPGRMFRDCPECPEMVVVPAGSFTMGSPSSEEGHEDGEGPQHRVSIPAPFAVGKYEVTFSEWDACVTAGGCNGYRPDDRGWGRGRRPVINVSWDDAKSYVGWLSRKTGKRYRLLSEAEWEYAARAGTTGPFHFGSTISTDQANYDGNYAYGSGRKGSYRRRSLPVGSFPANAFGLHDVHGNVWEWVEDCWHGSYAGAPTDGGAWVSGGDCGTRVLRGGSWDSLPRGLRFAYRGWYSSETRFNGLGFRVSRTLSP